MTGLEAADLDWMCRSAGVPDCWRRVMHLRHVDGLTDEVIAAELGLSRSSVTGYCSAAWAAIRGKGAPAVEVDVLQEQLAQPVGESKVEHAKALLLAMKGPGRGAAPTPIYDDNGRRAANHDPLVNLGDVLDIIQGRDPELYVVEPWER